MTEGPIVSVVTPCYNARPFLRAAYRSLQLQTLEDWEWIIADDGSTDKSLDYLQQIEEKDPRVHVYPGENTGLPAKARNRALSLATAKYVAFLDADDYFHPEKLARQVELLENNPDVGLTYSWVKEFRSGSGEKKAGVPTAFPRLEAGSDLFIKLLTRGNFLSMSTVMARRDLLQEFGGFDEDPDFRIGEDLDLWLRIAKKTRIARTPGILAAYRLHSGNVTKSGDFRFTEMIRQKLERRGDLEGHARRKFYSVYYLKRAEYGLLGIVNTDARKDFLRALKLDPLNPKRWMAALPVLILPAKYRRRFYSVMKNIQTRINRKRGSLHKFGANA